MNPYEPEYQYESSNDEFDPLEDKVAHLIDRALATIFESPEERGLQRHFRKHLHGMCRQAWIELLLIPLANLRTIEFTHDFIGADGGTVDLPLLVHRTACSVKEIAFQKVYSSDTILRWLEASPDLEHVAFQLSVHRDDRWTDFDASEFREALLPSRQTLKTLRLEVDEYFDETITDYQGENEEPFGAFTNSTMLQDLVIRHAHLTGRPSGTAVQDIPRFLVEMLPVCLKRLTVKDIMVEDLPDLLVMLQELVQHRDLFGQLEQITLCAGWLDDDLISPLRVASEAVGISLSVLDDDDYSYD